MTCEELNSVWALQKILCRERQRLSDLRVLAESTTPILDGMPHAKPLTFRLERLALMITETEALIQALANKICEAKCELLTKIQSFGLSDLHERVLKFHYVACMKLNEVSKRMNFSSRYVTKLHAQALRQLGLSFEDMRKAQSPICSGVVRHEFGYSSA